MVSKMKLLLALCCVIKCLLGDGVLCDEVWDNMSPEDREFFKSVANRTLTDEELMGRIIPRAGDDDATLSDEERAAIPYCYGLSTFAISMRLLFKVQPDSSDIINVHYYFSSRSKRTPVQVMPGAKFTLNGVNYDPKRPTVIIVHGYNTHSRAPWILKMVEAFLDWGDVNAIAVDWSGGGNTWKYWRALANTKIVGSDIDSFLRQLMLATGSLTKDFHFVGHSLGAQICSYAAVNLGGVGRITGLDPAQPCFETRDTTVLLDRTDADFVDIIHTNGRPLDKIGLGLPDPLGHADFYANGGMQQPGCAAISSFLSYLLPSTPQEVYTAMCNHGRAYRYFMESLVSKSCILYAQEWDLTYDGIIKSLMHMCYNRPCAQMGIWAAGGGGRVRAKGTYYVVTSDDEPFCPTEKERHALPIGSLLADLKSDFRIDRWFKVTQTDP